jgi:hypothetical protein
VAKAGTPAYRHVPTRTPHRAGRRPSGLVVAVLVVMRLLIARFSIIACAVGLSLYGAPARAADDDTAAIIRGWGQRPLTVAAVVSWPWMAQHDVTVPLPGGRLSVNVSPRLSLDLTGGWLTHDQSGRWTLVDLGARWFFATGPTSPYVVARAGSYFDRADEGDDHSYPYGVVGGGIEYACGCGLTLSGELGPALMGFADNVRRRAVLGVYGSVAIGFRFGLRP